jgi:hypothetical protein
MAYPQVSAPYGLQPINLIGGQVFAGATRSLPIQYGYGTNIFFGDFVVLSRGFITRAAVSTGTTVNQATGIFLGCSYTNPLTKQKTFSEYWPASTLAGDAVAIVCEDPDTVFKAVVCSATTVVASGALALVGTNLSMIDNSAVASSLATGNSANAVLAPTATPATTILPVRCVGLVPDTAFSTSATASSASSGTTVNVSGLTAALPIGTDVAYVASNGQLIETGSFVTAAAAAGASTVTINAQPNVLGAGTNIPSGATIVFTQYPEILVKMNLGIHGYYTAATSGAALV